MGNCLFDRDMDLYLKAIELFMDGLTVRQVAQQLHIAKETAQRIQKYGKIADVRLFGKTRVNTGKRKDGTISYYETSELREHWKKQHYGDGSDL